MSSLAGITIYIPEGSPFIGEPVLGELHVLDATADTLHNAGSHSRTRDIDFWVLDISNFSTIETAFKAGSTVTLVDWEGNSHSVVIRSLGSTPMTDIKRPPHYAVMRCRAKLMEV